MPSPGAKKLMTSPVKRKLMTSTSSGAPLTLEGAKFVPTAVYTSMDPRLQRVVDRRRKGIVTLATTSTEQDEAAVVAKITDLDKWEQLSEVQIGAAFGSKDPDGTLIVTGRIPVMRIEYVRQQPFVSSLKGAQLLQPTLNKTLKETGAHEDLLPKGNQVEGGKGVVVGIIDYGMDFVHQNFRNSGGSTRLLSIWDQAGPATAASPLGYGREYSRDEINHALGQNDPYAALGYGPAKDTRGTHGTHVADIAAGNGRGSSVPGVAPNADLVFVEVSHADISFSGPEVVGSSFGDSVRLLEAVQYIFHKAKERPCVINVSLGTNGGPHDGSTLVEDAIDRLIRQAPNRAVVIAASNSFSDGIHAAGKVRENGHSDLKWEVLTGDASYNELEVWYSGRDKFAVELIAPGGNSLGTINPGTNGTLVIENQVLIFVANRLDDPNNGDNMIGVFLERGLPAGQWIVRLHGLTSRDGSFHAWIERDNLTPSNFAPPHDNTHTLGSISCGHETIVVGSYDAHKVSAPLSFFSSSGPTRDDREKPEISAPGHGVLAAHSRTSTGVVRKSGTSMAAPAVTGIIALMLGQARAQGITLSTSQIRAVLTRTARRNPPSGNAWDPRYGLGRISASKIVQDVMALASPPVVPPGKPKKKKKKKAASGVRG